MGPDTWIVWDPWTVYILGHKHRRSHTVLNSPIRSRKIIVSIQLVI